MASRKPDLLVGTWRSLEATGSTVEYRIAKARGGYRVVAHDTSDGELADVFEEKWDADAGVFSFATHWNSTGRFGRHRFRVITKDQVELTCTYTDTEVLGRAPQPPRLRVKKHIDKPAPALLFSPSSLVAR